ncbi:MAG: hypothetical protein HC769_29710 [Cyanobacteria bacterium CRU_2_1]|nr:hypothetical protein [Cyanobacteria bacterium RU_5_0]NJR62609.1 hypothetical protein [Cyanobacteria bacterium CRU_2_1]
MLAALERASKVEFELIEDSDATGEVLIQQMDGTYLVTEHGATFLPAKAEE